MAIYHLSMQSIQWSKGYSAIAASAYRSGEKLYDERLDKTYDYTRKERVEYKDVMTPDFAPSWQKDRQTLWNDIDKRQRQKNSRPARELEISLPRELSLQDNIDLTKDFIKKSLVGRGLVADVAVHMGVARDGGENPHAHILFTTFKASPEGFEKTKWAALDSKKTLQQFRVEWEEAANKKLAEHGIAERIDHRSHKDRRITQKPTKYMGKDAIALEKKGIATDRGNENREIEHYNKFVGYNEHMEQKTERGLQAERGHEITASHIAGVSDAIDNIKHTPPEFYHEAPKEHYVQHINDATISQPIADIDTLPQQHHDIFKILLEQAHKTNPPKPPEQYGTVKTSHIGTVSEPIYDIADTAQSYTPLLHKHLYHIMKAYVASVSTSIYNADTAHTRYDSFTETHKQCLSYAGHDVEKPKNNSYSKNNTPQDTHDTTIFQRAVEYAQNAAIWIYEKPIEIFYYVKEQIYDPQPHLEQEQEGYSR